MRPSAFYSGRSVGRGSDAQIIRRVLDAVPMLEQLEEVVDRSDMGVIPPCA